MEQHPADPCIGDVPGFHQGTEILKFHKPVLEVVDLVGNVLAAIQIFGKIIRGKQLVMQQLINGPDSVKGADRSLRAVIPDNTNVNQITVRDQICYIDLTREFLTSIDGISRMVTLYSVVNSLVELPDINKVQFTIDGETINFFGTRSIVFDSPLERNLELIK